MNFRATLLRRLALAVLALGLSAQAFAGWYQVEVMIIAHNTAATGESLRQLPYPDYTSEAVHLGLQEAAYLPEQVDAALRDAVAAGLDSGGWQAGSDGLTLADMGLRMADSGKYRVLFHQRWRQPVEDGAPPVPVYLEGGQQINLPIAAPQEAPAATPFPPLTEAELQGTLQLSLSRSLQVDTDLWLAATDSDGLRHFSPMRESRRLGEGELHYLDSPHLGVLIRVTP